jgi:hypothetical protein
MRHIYRICKEIRTEELGRNTVTIAPEYLVNNFGFFYGAIMDDLNPKLNRYLTLRAASITTNPFCDIRFELESKDEAIIEDDVRNLEKKLDIKLVRIVSWK